MPSSYFLSNSLQSTLLSAVASNAEEACLSASSFTLLAVAAREYREDIQSASTTEQFTPSGVCVQRKKLPDLTQPIFSRPRFGGAIRPPCTLPQRQG